ncbi:MAG: LCP family protein [Actinomycetota bacterium]|nr:LCP family protein [Actinomycetota bacterium]
MSELRDRSNRAPKVSGVARHGRLKKSAAWKTALGLIGGTVVVALVAGVSIAGIAAAQLQSNIKTTKIAADTQGPPPNIASFVGGFNILLVGSDTRAGQGGIGGTVAQDAGALNDVTMLMHVAQDQKSATVVSIPRDMVVPYPKCPSGNAAAGLPLNNSLSYGGLACTVLVVQQLTGLTIQFAGLITFQGVIAMSDAVGGVDVCVAGAIHDPYTGLDLPSAGSYNLRGATALAFLRSRHGVGDGSDLGRIGSQQVYLSALVRKIKSSDTLTNLGKLYAIAQAATQNITLSENFTHLDTLVSVALVLKDIPLENIVFVQYPGKTGGTGIYAGKVQPQTAVANALFAAIKADQPIGLDSNSLSGAHNGSTTDPSAPAATATPTPTSAGTAKATLPADNPSSAPAAVIPGLMGQSAATYTCSQPFKG